MASTLQLVDTDLSTVLFDFNSTTGTGNPNSVITLFGAEGAFTFTAPPEIVTVAPPSAPGGRVVYRRDPLGTVSWGQIISATSADNLIGAVGELSRLLALGGTLKWIPHGSSETRYIDFEPSATPVIFDGQPMGLWNALQRFSQGENPLQIMLTCQPYMYGATLSGTANKLKNAALVLDNDGTANRPDNWTWSATTGLSAESIAVGTDWGYKFTKADGTAVNLQQTTAVASFASGDIATFSFYAKVDAVAGTPQMQATLQFKQSDGTTNVGSLFSGGLVTLTTSWQRISVTTTAAGALTSRAQLSVQQDNADATSVVCRIRMAQAEVAASTSAFRVGAETVAYDPAATGNANRKLPVYCQGNAPALARLTATADASLLTSVKVWRESTKPVDVSNQTMHKQLESGTLGSDTTSQADGNASGGNYARVAYTTSNPSLRADNSAGGTGQSIAVTKPSGTAVGDVLVGIVWRSDETTLIQPPAGWKVLGFQQNTTGTFASHKSIMWVFYCVADATQVAASTYTFTVIADAAGTRSYRAWVGAFQNVDNTLPIDTFTFSTEANTTAATATGITTTRNNNMVITAYGGNNSAGAFSATAPAGTTPTYTEQDDGQSDQTFRGMAVDTGVLATAGATGNKDSTIAIAIDATMINMALNVAPPALAARSTVTFSSLVPGKYDVWIRRYADAASIHRIRVEWAPMASPTVWNALPDEVMDLTGASAFAYADRYYGQINVPADFTTPTVTFRISSGIESGTAQNLRLDVLMLHKADETAGEVVSPTILASGEFLVGDASLNKAYHLDTSSQTKEIATAAGPTLVELNPGLNLLSFEFLQDKAAGFVDRASTLGAVPTITVQHAPKYRT